MNAETHIAIGATIGALILRDIGATRLDASSAIIVLTATLGALLPDLDHEASLISRRAGLLAMPFRLVKHRGLTHSLAALVLIYLLLDALNPPQSILIALLAGYASHIVADMLTPHGVELLFPVRWRLRLLPRSLSISTGSAFEHLLSGLVMLVALIILVPLAIR